MINERALHSKKEAYLGEIEWSIHVCGCTFLPGILVVPASSNLPCTKSFKDILMNLVEGAF